MANATVPFRPVTWQPNDPLYTKKLNQMVNNEQWLFDRMPRAAYHAAGIFKMDGVRVLGGRAVFHSRKKGHDNQRISFGNFFTPRSMPIVTATPVSNQHRIHVSVHGIGQLAPDHRGAIIAIRMDERNKKKNNIKRMMYVSWIALGY